MIYIFRYSTYYHDIEGVYSVQWTQLANSQGRVLFEVYIDEKDGGYSITYDDSNSGRERKATKKQLMQAIEELSND